MHSAHLALYLSYGIQDDSGFAKRACRGARRANHVAGVVFLGQYRRAFASRFVSVDVNPFGTLYNPASIAAAVRRLMENRPYSEAELFEFGGMWHSFDHHSKFSCADRSMALQKINARYEGGVRFLKTARWLIVTFGTAYAYCLSDTGAVVGNCHKMPASCFSRRLLSQRDVVDDWLATLACLHEWNPELKVIFTVSPIRHLADGAHGNQLSKSTLLLAIDELSRCAEWISYFPAFEIVMDELRDYRFYAADMVHPSDVAVDYVMERFSEACFSESARKSAKRMRTIFQIGIPSPTLCRSVGCFGIARKTRQSAFSLLEKIPYLRFVLKRIVR